MKDLILGILYMLGFVFLGQIPDWMSVIGYIIIIGSAVFKWNYMNRTANSGLS